MRRIQHTTRCDINWQGVCLMYVCVCVRCSEPRPHVVLDLAGFQRRRILSSHYQRLCRARSADAFLRHSVYGGRGRVQSPDRVRARAFIPVDECLLLNNFAQCRWLYACNERRLALTTERTCNLIEHDVVYVFHSYCADHEKKWLITRIDV